MVDQNGLLVLYVGPKFLEEQNERISHHYIC